MVLSFEKVGALLDQMAETFPPEFFEGLNGGIILEPDAHKDPDFPDDEIYFMGEFCQDILGSHINLYYGSFAALAKLEDWTAEDWEEELYTTLAHELTHHVEGLAGVRDLEVKDEEQIEALRRATGTDAED